MSIDRSSRTSAAAELMTAFAARTGIATDHAPRRYLWTDAFAVCNFIGLERATGDQRYRDLALRLVDHVHHELGVHRDDDRRAGWISGLSAAEGEAHPTHGGLRIGKPLPERAAAEPVDESLEWERDGQYFHYLTKWMHALDQVARATGHPAFNQWARELADTAHRAFTYGPLGATRMVWKLSIDLARPLVASAGHLDPLDGLVSAAELEATAAALGIPDGPRLGLAMVDYSEMLEHGGLVTSDPLGIGSLLVGAYRLAHLDRADDSLIAALLEAAVTGLPRYVAEPDLTSSADRRLAFRELGLAIGLASVSMFAEDLAKRRLHARTTTRHGVARLATYTSLRDEIEAFWRSPERRRTPAWLEHEDINEVMLATSLLPDGLLAVGLPRRSRSRIAASIHP